MTDSSRDPESVRTARANSQESSDAPLNRVASADRFADIRAAMQATSEADLATYEAENAEWAVTDIDGSDRR